MEHPIYTLNTIQHWQVPCLFPNQFWRHSPGYSPRKHKHQLPLRSTAMSESPVRVGPNENCWTFLFPKETEQCYCGQELANLFLHAGSGWLLTEATDASEAVMNNLSLLSRSTNRRQLTGMAGRARTAIVMVPSLAFVFNSLHTCTATPTVTA